MSGTAQPNTLSTEDKKRLKRAANRRSAQLSRQRKKKFIEELTVEHSKLKQVTEILAAMSDIILMVDSSGNIIFASEAAHRVLQFSDGAFFGRNIYSLVADDSRRHLQEALQTAATDYKRRSALQLTGREGNSNSEGVDDRSAETAYGDEGIQHEPAAIPRCAMKFVRKDGGVVVCELSGSVARLGAPTEGGGDDHVGLRFICAARPQSERARGRAKNSSRSDSGLSSSAVPSNYRLSTSGCASGSTSGGTDSDSTSTSGSVVGSEG